MREEKIWEPISVKK